MHTTIMILVATLRETFLSRASLHLENLALRQRVAVLKRERRRAVAPDARPLVLGHPFPPLAALARGAGDRKAGYRNTATFITKIYLIPAPLGNLFDSI